MNPGAQRDQIRLWLSAFVVSLAFNVVLVLALGWWVVEALKKVVKTPADTAPPETVVTIVPIPATPESGEAPAENAPKAFARTSADQEADTPEKPAFIGERDTRATSDAPEVATAPPIPSQQGREPDRPEQIETT